MRGKLFIIFTLITITFSRCIEDVNPYSGLKLPDGKEYNEIVLAIIKQDTDLINSKLLETECVGLYMAKLKISFNNRKPDSNNIEILTFPSYRTSFKELLHYGIADSNNRSSDSLFLLFQNDSSRNIEIDSNIVKSVKFATTEIIHEYWRVQRFGYLEFTLPILNKQMTKAFVQTNFRCNGLCGEGKLYILEKINNRWTIKLVERTWVG